MAETNADADLGRQLARRLVGDAGHRAAVANLDFFVDTMPPGLLAVWADLAGTGPGGLADEVYFVMHPADRGDAGAAEAFWRAAGHPLPSADFLRAFIEQVAVEIK